MNDPVADEAARDFGPLMSLDNALQAILSVIAPVAVSWHPLQDALSRIAAEPIRSRHRCPPRPIAMRDGYMVASRDTVGATPYAPAYVAGPLRVVHAGAAMAEGFDAVLPPDGVVIGPAGVEVLQSAFPGSGVRHAGEDLAIGDLHVATGDRIRPDHLALLALTGVESVALRIPRLSVEGTNPLASMVAALASTAGASIDAGGDVDATVVLCDPGYAASAAAVERVLAQGRLIAHGLAVNPGGSTAIGTVTRPDGGSRIVFVVPGRLEDVLAVWLMIIAPTLAHLAGTNAAQTCRALPLSAKIVSAPGVADLVLLRRTAEVEPCWEPLAVGHVPWSAFAAADAYCLVAADQEGFPEGMRLRGVLL